MGASFAETFAGQTMNLDLSKVIAAEQRKLASLCTDIFLIVIRMREAEALGEPTALVKLIKYYLNLFEKNCGVIGMPESDIANAKYALVALLDETVLSIPGPCRDYWISSPLQLQYFGDNLAGQEFYRRLDKMLLEAEKTREVLELYYLCLSLGFEGKYRISNAEEREQIIDNVGRTLRRTSRQKAPVLSPHGRRTRVSLAPQRGERVVPLWVVGAVAAGFVAAAWGLFAFMASSKATDVLSRIR